MNAYELGKRASQEKTAQGAPKPAAPVRRKAGLGYKLRGGYTYSGAGPHWLDYDPATEPLGYAPKWTPKGAKKAIAYPAYSATRSKAMNKPPKAGVTGWQPGYYNFAETIRGGGRKPATASGIIGGLKKRTWDPKRGF